MSSDHTSAPSRRILSRSRHDESSDTTSRSHRQSHTTPTKPPTEKTTTQQSPVPTPKTEAQETTITTTTNLDASLTLSSHQQQQQHNLAVSYINKEPFNEDIDIEETTLITELKWRDSVIDRLREKIAEIKSLKLENKNKQLIATAYRQGLLLCASIKKLNRVANCRVNKARNMTHEEKNKIDEFHLELQNLLYEISHLQAETNKCLEFRSLDEEICLVDLESFYANAPVEVSQPEVTRLAENEHKLRLARLDWELTERQMMLGKIKELEKQIEVRELELKEKQNKLEALNPKLNQILEACKPTLDYFNTNLADTAVFSESVQLLPKPLYHLYMMMTAHRDTVDKDIDIEVCGDLEEARRYDLSDTLDLDDSESDSNDDEADTDYKKKKSSKAKSSKQKVNIREKLFSKFPLSCRLIMQIDSYGELSLEFFYLNYLKIVAVKIESSSLQKDTTVPSESLMLRPETMFHCLYPGDNGSESPNLSNKYLFSNTGVKSMEAFMKPIGVAYRWCQVLCGLYYGNRPETRLGRAVNEESGDKCEVDMVLEEGDGAEEDEEEELIDQEMDMFELKDLNESKLICQILNRIKSRFKARYILQKTINSTKNLNVSNPRLRVQSSLVSCRESSAEKFASFAYTQHLLNQPSLQINETDCTFYEILLINSAAKLQAQVAINQDYPRIAPLFAINIHWKQQERNFINDEAIRDMERELNVYLDNFEADLIQPKRVRRSQNKLAADEKNYELLTKQIGHLLVCFDIYLESESYFLQDNEYQRMKLFPRTVRGRDRKRPYSYMANKDLFVQRMLVNVGLGPEEQINQ